MPGKRITDLTALSGANSANNDDLVIFDATASETKRISRSQLAEGMQADVQVFSNKTIALANNIVNYNQGGAGAVTRTVQSRLRDYVSVKDFGAVGDGVTNDTAAIQAAIDAMTAAGGGTVYLPATGRNAAYKVTSSLSLGIGVQLCGAGPNNTRIQMVGNFDLIYMARSSVVSDLRIIADPAATTAYAAIVNGATAFGDSYNTVCRNLIIGGLNTALGDSSNAQHNIVGIQGGNSFWFLVDNVMVSNAGIGYRNYAGQTRGTLANTAILFNQFKAISCGTGAMLSQTNDVVFIQPSFTSSDEHGLIVGDCRTLNITGAHFESNHRSGTASIQADILIDSTAVGGGQPSLAMTIQDCRFNSDTLDYCVYAVQGQNIYLKTNHFKDAIVNSVKFENAASGYAVANTISGGADYDGRNLTRDFNVKRYVTLSIPATSWSVIDSISAGERLDLTINQSPIVSARSWTGAVISRDTGAVFSYALDSAGLIVSSPGSAAAWVTSTAYTAGDFVRNANKLYLAATTGTSGATAPTHTSGTVSDGGVNWLYISTDNEIALYNSSGSTRAYICQLSVY